MPKNSVTVTLKRWKELDRELCGRGQESSEGLNVRAFARRWRVSVDTIRRDLKAFKAMGQRLVSMRDDYERRYFWGYKPGTAPLFVSNLPSWIREVVTCRRCQLYHHRDHRPYLKVEVQQDGGGI